MFIETLFNKEFRVIIFTYYLSIQSLIGDVICVQNIWALSLLLIQHDPRFAAFSKIWLLTILRLLPFIQQTNFRTSSKSLGFQSIRIFCNYFFCLPEIRVEIPQFFATDIFEVHFENLQVRRFAAHSKICPQNEGQ